jgi:hypothetical protein
MMGRLTTPRTVTVGMVPFSLARDKPDLPA